MRLVSHSVGINEEDIMAENFILKPPGRYCIPEEEEMNKPLIHGGIAAESFDCFANTPDHFIKKKKACAELHSRKLESKSKYLRTDRRVKVPPINPIRIREEVKEFAK